MKKKRETAGKAVKKAVNPIRIGKKYRPELYTMVLYAQQKNIVMTSFSIMTLYFDFLNFCQLCWRAIVGENFIVIKNFFSTFLKN